MKPRGENTKNQYLVETCLSPPRPRAGPHVESNQKSLPRIFIPFGIDRCMAMAGQVIRRCLPVRTASGSLRLSIHPLLRSTGAVAFCLDVLGPM